MNNKSVSRKLRLMHVIPDLDKGGAERSVIRMAEGIRNSEYVEDVLILLFNDNIQYQSLVSNLKIEICNSRITPHLLRPYEVDLKSYFSIIKKFKPNVIQSHLLDAEILTREYLFPDIGYLSHFHINHSLFDNFQFSFLKYKTKLANYFVKRRLMSRYRESNTHFITISNDSYQFYLKRMPFSTSLFYNFINPVDLLKFHPNREIKPPSNNLKLIAIARLHKIKSPEKLVEIMYRLINRGLECTLDIFGDGPEYESLNNLIISKNLHKIIILHGNVENPQDYLNKSNIFIHTADSETCPNVILEAMACGLPCVAFDVCGVNELIKHNKTGFLIENGDFEEFCNKIEDLFNNPDLYLKFSTDALTEILNYNMDPYITNLVDLYKKILKFHE